VKDVIDYRRSVDADRPLVVGFWIESYRTAHAAGLIPMHQYHDVYREAVTWVLERPGVETWVAFKPGEEAGFDLYGWIAVERDVMVPKRVRRRVEGRMQWVEELVQAECPLVHYVFVKESFRRRGIGRGLFVAAGVDLRTRFLFTCKTALSSELEQRLAPEAAWRPLVARYPKI